MRNSFVLALPVIALGILAGCSSGSSTPAPAGNGTMNVTLVDGPTSAYQAIYLNITTVEISKDGSSWITLANLNQAPVNLLSLTGGIAQTLAQGATLAPGTYGQMRLILGSTGNTVVLNDGSTHDLTIPSGAQSGIKLVGSFVVQAGTTADIWIDFDGAHSLQVVGAGNSGKYLLRPVIFAYDKAVTGSISGTLTDAATSAGLPSVPVMAEVLDGSGNPSVVRTTVTDTGGKYTLDLLPVGGTYYVVALPVTGAGSALTVYDPKASAALALTTAAPVLTYSAPFTSDASLGSIAGTVTPAATADQSDTVNLLGSLGGQSFILGTTVATVGTSAETFAFSNLPAAAAGTAYALVGVRTNAPAGATPTVTSTMPVPVTVLPGTTPATATVGF